MIFRASKALCLQASSYGGSVTAENAADEPAHRRGVLKEPDAKAVTSHLVRIGETKRKNTLLVDDGDLMSVREVVACVLLWQRHPNLTLVRQRSALPPSCSGGCVGPGRQTGDGNPEVGQFEHRKGSPYTQIYG